MTYISFSILGDPVAKERPRFAKNGHVYTPSKTRVYEEMVRLHAIKAMKGKKMLTGAIELTVALYFPRTAGQGTFRRNAIHQKTRLGQRGENRIGWLQQNSLSG